MKQLEKRKQIAQEFSDLIVYCIAVQFDLDSKYGEVTVPKRFP